MDDYQITELFWSRSQHAPEELQNKYGGFLFRLAMNLLSDRQDSEECVNDTYLRVWNSIPPNRPQNLRLYAGRITRNLALDRIRMRQTEKRNGTQSALLDELEECIPCAETVETSYRYRLLVQEINRYVDTLDDRHAYLFVRRYWYGEELAEIAKKAGIPERTVATYLYRMRKELKIRLEKAGIQV